MNSVDFSTETAFKSEFAYYGDTVIWKDHNWLERCVRRLFTTENYRLNELTVQYRKAVEECESCNVGNPIELNEIGNRINLLIRQARETKPTLFLQLANFVHSIFSKVRLSILTTDSDLRRSWKSTNLARMAMQYRFGLLEKRPEIDSLLEERLSKVALEWKGSQKLYSVKQRSSLTAFEQRAIKHLCRYHDYAVEVLGDSKLRHHNFKMLFGHGIRVSHLVKYPKSIEKLYRAHMTSRVGGLHSYQGENRAKVRRLKELEGGGLGLRIAYTGKFVDVMSNETVRVGPYTKARMSEIIEDFHNKNVRQGKFEMFWDGVHLWDPHHYRINYDRLDWYHQLPVFEKISFSELQKMFPEKTIRAGDSVWVYESTRQTLDRDGDGSHGYWVIYEPDEEGLYRVWPFGVFAEFWPEETLDQFVFIGNTVQGVIAYPDPNYAFYPHRQKGRVPVVINSENQLELIHLRTKLRELASNPALPFQWGGINCAPRAEKLVLGSDGALVQTPIETIKVQPYLYPFLMPYLAAPKILKPMILWFLVHLVGGSRELYGASLKKSAFLKHATMYYPGRLHERIEEKAVEGGTIHAGHNRDYEPVGCNQR